MSSGKVHQIHYSEATRLANDPGFLPLDNMANPRPDWREYWPMRAFLLQNALEPDVYHGFFSPKFKHKTGLSAGDVHAFIAEQGGQPDVITFSPFFDQSAFALNVFEQGAAQHREIAGLFQAVADLLVPGLNVNGLIMDSSTSVYCNYFVAKPPFWAAWLGACERVFNEAEANTSAIARQLNASTNHDGGVAPNKVFVIERMVSLLLSLNPAWKIKAYDPVQMPYSTAPIARFRQELIQMDALKTAYRLRGFPEYLTAFAEVRASVISALSKP